MERDLVVCCDGTWNGPSVELVTNVQKLFNCLEQSDQQLCYYQPGVGTSANPLRWFFGGATGTGIRYDVINAYSWLARHYKRGDRIWLFGFSRGAFTARSVAGMISVCGIVDGAEGGPRGQTFHRQVEAAFEQYRATGNGLQRSYVPNSGEDPDYPVYFIGVWDTVGSLGIPDHLALLNAFDAPHRYQFHSVHLDPRVRHARHCLALDENRAPFMPTLWEGENDERMKQVWFPGSHVDVGGGYRDAGLSATTLLWMINEARRVHPALRFDDDMVKTVETQKKPLGPIHDDARVSLEALGPAFILLKPVLDYIFSPRPRSTPAIEEVNRWSKDSQRGSVNEVVFERQKVAAPETGYYHPHIKELTLGSSHKLRVQANTEWNSTGLYLRPGSYSLSATGEWRDPGGHWSGPDGESWGALKHPIFSSVGLVERTLNALGSVVPESLRARLPGLLRVLIRSRETGKRHAAWTRRVEEMPWMALLGVVANGRIRGSESIEHQTFLIGSQSRLVVDVPGYFYVFANHAWSAYQENWGEMELTIKCDGLAAEVQSRSQGVQPPVNAISNALQAVSVGDGASTPT